MGIREREPAQSQTSPQSRWLGDVVESLSVEFEPTLGSIISDAEGDTAAAKRVQRMAAALIEDHR